jgi:hypothetical protein
MTPEHYLGSSYYEHWLTAAATLAVEAGLVTQAQLEERAGGTFPLSRPERTPSLPAGHENARFAVGDRVRVRNMHPPGHTRCPRYVRGHVGTVLSCDGRSPLPDVEAHAPGPPAEATYTVQFEATELWDDDQLDVKVAVGMWDSYLDPQP